jgi:hypothetical protein
MRLNPSSAPRISYAAPTTRTDAYREHFRSNEGMMSIYKQATFRHLLLTATLLASPLIAAAPTRALAQVAIGISVQIAPPLLPVYAQPAMPEVGYVWTPGYWGWEQPEGYYWVPGTWIQPPVVGVLWTPPYWGWNNGAYVFNGGYWGPQVGFYGGVNYGYGYGGHGYDGGRWNGNNFAYNRAANNFGSAHVQNSYEQPLIVNNRTNISYAGGADGIKAEPTAAERSAAQGHHTAMTAEQTRHVAASATDPALAANRNNGHPTVAAMSRPVGTVPAARGQPTGAEHAGEPATAAHPAVHAAGPTAGAHPVARAAEPAAAGHPAAHAAEPANIAAHAAEPVAVAHPVARTAAPAAAVHPVAAHPAPPAAAAHPVASAATHPAVAHAAVRPAPPRPAQHAAAPHVAPAREEAKKG